ncbi:LPS assembly lipoprotein LptE [Methylobacillus sp. MM3]|uniref:LPS-assembly lipoprotein LptE n=1 Tax=Methylobacillus sp. MM3 TaxID=1848039 RepID=UPI000AA3BE56|nr:LPS assembly lipoprotein LptE [Methylobacillus sp. MM3]
MKLTSPNSHMISRNLLLAFCLLALAACGFQLRGATELGFKKLYLQKSNASALAKELRRSLTSSGVEVVATPEEAEMLLELSGESTEKNILSLSGGGKVREYELIYRVTIRLREASSELWGIPQLIEQRRDYSYDDTQLLAKEGEEARLYSDMRSDSAREILRRLNAINTSKPKAAN